MGRERGRTLGATGPPRVGKRGQKQRRLGGGTRRKTAWGQGRDSVKTRFLQTSPGPGTVNQKYLCESLYPAAQGRMRGWWREPGKDAVLSGQCAEGPGLDFWNPLRTGERLRTASSERCMQQAHTIFPASLSALVDFPRLAQEPGKEPLLTGISHLPGPCSHLSFTRGDVPWRGGGT